MKNNQFETRSTEHILKKNDEYSDDFSLLIGKKIELSFKNREPIIGILNRCAETDVEILICNHIFMINRNEIVGIRNFELQKDVNP